LSPTNGSDSARRYTQAKQLVTEAAWELDKAQMALQPATGQVDMAMVEQHRVSGMKRLVRAMAVATELEVAMANLPEPTSVTVHRAAHSG
jgi:hypothetical protein